MIDMVVGWEVAERSLREFLRSGSSHDDSEPDAMSSLRARVAERSGQTIASLAWSLGVDDASVDTVAFALVSMVDGTAARWATQPQPKPSRSELVGELASYAWAVLYSVARRHGLVIDSRMQIAEVIDSLTSPKNHD